MNTTITFPFFGFEWDPAQNLEIGSFSLHIYGLLIGLGLMLAIVYAWKRSKQFGIKNDDITDGVLWIVPFAILCARLYYCIFQWDSYKDDPISILYIWNGGLAIYGGVIGAVIGIAVYCRIKKIKMAALLDLVLLGFLIGQAIGRWGNFFNREAYGAETEIFIRMGLFKDADGGYSHTMHYFHPTFLYESLWNTAGFVLLHFLSKKRQYDGQIALGYIAWYGLGRTCIEGLRTDSLMLGDLRISQILAGVTAIGAVITLFVLSMKMHSPDKLFVNQVAAMQAAADEEDDDEEDDDEEDEILTPESDEEA